MRKILVIDDEADFCDFLKKNLEIRGDYEVIICVRGDQALDQAKVHKPDLVIIDIMLPQNNGCEIALNMTQEPELSEIPFIFLTALLQLDELKKQYALLKDHHCISKPVRIARMIEIIEEVIDQTHKG